MSPPHWRLTRSTMKSPRPPVSSAWGATWKGGEGDRRELTDDKSDILHQVRQVVLPPMAADEFAGW
jgi:hypothetical protein